MRLSYVIGDALVGYSIGAIFVPDHSVMEERKKERIVNVIVGCYLLAQRMREWEEGLGSE